MSTSKKTPQRIFISHTGADKPIVDAIVIALKKTLNRNHKKAFFYSSDGRISIESGDGLVDKVVENLKADKTACVVAFLTEKSYTKPWLHFEAGAAYLQSRLISVLLPGCPDPKDIGENHPFFTRGLYHDLIEPTEQKLGEFYAAISQFFETDNDSLEEQKKKFAELFYLNVNEFLVDQVAAVCVRKLDGDDEAKILLIKNIDTVQGKRVPGVRRHFPKEDVKVAGRVLPSDVVAAVSAAKEAAVVVAPIENLGTFRHFKHTRNKEFKVTAYAMEYYAESEAEIERANVLERDPQWYTQERALIEVAVERKPEYAKELQNIVREAFYAWNKRNGR